MRPQAVNERAVGSMASHTPPRGDRQTQEASVVAQASPVERFPAFDRLRTFCMLFIIFWHSTLAYVQPTSWPVHDTPSVIASTLAYGSMGFTLKLFFVMSGFFGAMVVARKGAPMFVRHRLMRIMVPGVAFAALHSVLLAGKGPIVLAPYHLWFLHYLLLISLLVLMFALVVARGPARLRASLGVFGALLVRPRGIVLLMLPTALMLYLNARFGSAEGRWKTFTVEPYLFADYTLLFGFGWLLYRQRASLQRISAAAVPLVVTGLGLRVLSYPLWTRSGAVASVLGVPAELANAVVTSAYTWMMVFGLIGVFHRYLSRDTQGARFVSDSAYWCYIAHLLPVLVLQTVMTRVDGPVALKYLGVAGGTSLFCLITYRYFVRYTVLGWLLNGRRTRGAANSAKVEVLSGRLEAASRARR